MANFPVPIEAVSRLGFGCYRVRTGAREHYVALEQALARGCTLIDTASNYSNGRSEALVGEVLEKRPCYSAFVVTKIGYISPAIEALLASSGIRCEDLPILSSESKYCLRPDVIRAQMDISRARLRRTVLDAVLVHNPEHYFECQGVSPSRSEYRSTMQSLFELFEDWIHEGKLRYYGVSSDSLVSNWPVQLDELVGIAKEVVSAHHFTFVQFPLNFVEREALVSRLHGRNLIEAIRNNELVSIGNRGLNGRRGAETIRFATYEEACRGLNPEEAAECYERCTNVIRAQLSEVGASYDVTDFSIMRFLRDNWRGVEHPDLVDEIFNRHFYPFVDCIWAGQPPELVKRSCAALHRFARLYAKLHLTEKGARIRTELLQAGFISADDTRSLAQIACSFGLSHGLDHLVVGMRASEYVDDLAGFFSPRLAQATSIS